MDHIMMQDGHDRLSRRAAFTGGMVCAASLALQATPASARVSGIGRSRDPFQAALDYVGSVYPSQIQNFSGRCPDGSPFRLRIATPLDPPRTVPVVLLAGASAVPINAYDRMISALAGRGYLVIVPEFVERERETRSEGRWRRLAEMRYACDQIFAVRAVLGGSAERMEPNLIAAWGHADGCCVAMRLVGFDHNLMPDGTFADGRFRAAVALEPSGGFAIDDMGQVGRAYAQSTGGGLIIAGRGGMPPAPEGSGLLGLMIDSHQADLAAAIPVSSRRNREGARAFEVGLAASLIYFDWHLRDDRRAAQALNALNGRDVPGLEAPLVFLKA
jgi:hypothetical protein